MRLFLYYITTEDGRSGKVVNGIVTYTGVRTPLLQSPSGWQDLQIAYERNLVDHGVIRNYTLPFGFVLDGGIIIRDALYRESLEAKRFLLIQQLTLVYVPGVTFKWLYDYLYKGELDLSAADDKQDMISVPCMEGGLSKLLKANRATKYTYDFDLEAVEVKLDGILFDVAGHYFIPELDILDIAHTLPVTFLSKEGIFGSDVAFLSSNYSDLAQSYPYDLSANLEYFFTTTSLKQVRVSGFVVIESATNGALYDFIIQDNFNTEYFRSNPSGLLTYNIGTHTIPFDVTITLPANTKLFAVATNGLGSIKYLDSTFDVSFEYTFRETIIKAYKKSTLYRKLVGSVCGDETKALSALCLLWDYIVVTSGDAIRGLANPTITTSLDDFFHDMDSTFMAGLSVAGGLIELESRTKYYDITNPVDLGNVKDVEYSPATDIICNKFKFGHVKPDIEDINGKYDPNGSSEFTGPITKVVKDYNMISPYKAGPYEIESLRLNLDGKVSTDDNRDNDVYVINCLPLLPSVQDVSFDSTNNSISVTSLPDGVTTGVQIQITGSASNDGFYNVLSATTGTILVSGTLVTEGPVSVTITIVRGGLLTLNRPAYTILDGVPNATIFNLPQLTPKAMLLAHMAWIAGMNTGLLSQKIKFNSGNKNTELITELAGVTIDEDADESLNQTPPMFLGFYATFTTQVPTDLVNIEENTPNRCFTAFDEARGVQIKGFLMAGAISVNDRKEQEFRLLLSPDNNLIDLI